MKLSLHILKAHTAPFIGSFLILMFLFILQFIMKFMDQLVGKGLSGAVIAELMMLNLAWMVVLAVPMAVLVATLMAFGGMASTNEITAMKAGGMSLVRMMAPVIAMSLLVTYAMIEFNNKVLPEANHRSKTLTIDIRRKKPTLTLIPGLFNQDMPGYSMLVRKTFEESNNFEGVTIYNHADPNKNTVITAKHGSLSFSGDYRKLVMDLYDGEIHEIDHTKPNMYRIVKFERQRLTTRAEGFDFERSAINAFTRGDRELSSGEMRYMVDSLAGLIREIQNRFDGYTQGLHEKLFSGSVSPQSSQKDFWKNVEQYSTMSSQLMFYRNNIDSEISNLEYQQKQIREYLVEIHKKYSIPVACFVFILVGAPLGVMARRGGFGIAASLSLGFFLLYWSSLIGGEKLADRQIIEPWIGMWIANMFIGVLGIFLTYKIGKENIELNFTWWRKFIPKKLQTTLFSDSETTQQ
ncbi:MAG: LptF/LptG family permease [Ignavibacteriales bacterium]|nr:LptF/LptG family permease [Ignavibacteriales bacterium]